MNKFFINKYFTAIIGGGFSGLCLAGMLGKKYSGTVAVIEGNSRVGKKILATGNGQGNISNVRVDKTFYHGDVGFASRALERFGNKELLEFFSSIGLVTCEREGKIYPASLNAGAVLDVLRFKLKDENVWLFTENYVTKICKNEGCFEIIAENGNTFYAENVVLAFGGSSGAGFLTDGRSYALAKGFGHTVTDLSPSLVQIKTDRGKLKGLKGIRQEVNAALYGDNKKICEFSGDILFTDYGLSGNAVFALSAYLKGIKNPRVKLEFLPEFTYDDLYNKLIAKSSGVNLERLLVSVLPSRLQLAVIREAKLTPGSAASEENIRKIMKVIKGFVFDVEGTLGFESSQVTAGGINCGEVNPDTMESRLTGGLYIIGEALDVDGNCGGYNLQWAFTSAAVAAEALCKKHG